MRDWIRLTILAVMAAIVGGSAMAQSAAPAAPAQKTVAERLGYPADSRLLIIHADDFGMMHSVDTAIEEAFEKKWITSASILVPCPWFPEVARWAKEHPDADLGIHLALNADWTGYRWPAVSPQAPGSSLLDADGYLPLTTEYVVAHAKMDDVATETHAQVDKAKAAGIRLTHLDTHMGTIVSSGDLLRVYFTNEHDGVAVGLKKLVAMTHDGGETWGLVKGAEDEPGDPRYSAFIWAGFATPKLGVVLGTNNPPRRFAPFYPDWLDPQATLRMRDAPHLAYSLGTDDGGKTWRAKSMSSRPPGSRQRSRRSRPPRCRSSR